MAESPRQEFIKAVKRLGLCEPDAIDVAYRLFTTFAEINLLGGPQFAICTVEKPRHRGWLKQWFHKKFGCKSTHYTVHATGKIEHAEAHKIKNGQILYLVKDDTEQDD